MCSTSGGSVEELEAMANFKGLHLSVASGKISLWSRMRHQSLINLKVLNYSGGKIRLFQMLWF